jgi:di/tricarboxylate transporter
LSFTLPSPPILALLLVGLALVLFVFTKLRHDAVALILLVAVALLGLVPKERLFEGFGHPVVITVAAVLVLSAGLQRAGVISLLTSQIEFFTQNRYMHLGFLAGVCVLASAFMNNVGALALLMPLAFASMLGGMTTLIGTRLGACNT